MARLFATSSWLGWLALVCAGVLGLALVGFAIRELSAMARLSRVDRLQKQTSAASAGSRDEAIAALDALDSFYAGRSDMRWGRERIKDLRPQLLDNDALMAAAERELMHPLDAAALAEVEAAARRVAVVTALVPLALVDVAAALAANVRLIRRIAAIYGGRAGTFGSVRLLRVVSAHLVATGALALGDDMVGAALGGGVVSKLSRRFGEGILNAALTARVGIAAMEVCRPLEFSPAARPSVTRVLRQALAQSLPET